MLHVPTHRVRCFLQAGRTASRAPHAALKEFAPSATERVLNRSSVQSGICAQWRNPAHLGMFRVLVPLPISRGPFSDAAALVSIEALSSGALSLAAYHSGMVALDDALAVSLADDAFASLMPGPELTQRLASLVVRILDRYPTAALDFRNRIHEIAARLYPSWRETASAHLDLLRSVDFPVQA